MGGIDLFVTTRPKTDKRAGHFCQPPALHPRAGAERLTFCQHARAMPREPTHCRTGTYVLYAATGIVTDRYSPGKSWLAFTGQCRSSMQVALQSRLCVDGACATIAPNSKRLVTRRRSGGASHFCWPPAVPACRAGLSLGLRPWPRNAPWLASVADPARTVSTRHRASMTLGIPLGSAGFPGTAQIPSARRRAAAPKLRE
jgi:hypothetical protein